MTLQEAKAQSSGLSLEMNYLGRSDKYLGDTWMVQFIVTNHGDDADYEMYAFANNYDMVLPISFNDTFFLKHGENEFTVHFECFESGTTEYGFYVPSGQYEIKDSITCPLSDIAPELISVACTFNGPGTDFRGCELPGAILPGAELAGADLSDANFSRADLTNADLSGANLSGVDLTKADLSGANLSGANLSGAILKDVKFNGANLSNANLSGADLSKYNNGSRLNGANLSGADLTYANFNGATMTGANLDGANLSGATFSASDLSGAIITCKNHEICYNPTVDCSLRGQGVDLHGCRLGGVSFFEMDLTGANLSGAKLREANFYRATLVGADLSDADLTFANLGEGNFSGANLSNANLNGATLTRTDFTNAILTNADLSGVKYFGSADLTGVTRDCINDDWCTPIVLADCSLRGPGVDLHDCDFTGADLSFVDLSSANLSGATFVEAKLMGTIFTDANLLGTRFHDANLSGADFSGTFLEYRAFIGATLPGANFDGANLHGAHLSSADFSGATFIGANLKSASFFNSNLTGADLTSADLTMTSFVYADLTDAKLIGANLRAAIFDNTILYNADFSDIVDVTYLNIEDTKFYCLKHEICTQFEEDARIAAEEEEAKRIKDEKEEDETYLSDYYSTQSNLDTFDYSMPDRFGLDSNNDGLIDYYSGDAKGFDINTSKNFVNPNFWRVDFHACNVVSSGDTLQWKVNDNLFPKLASECDDFYYGFPEEGKYFVTLDVTHLNSSDETFTREIIVQDWLVVAIGDSYASGEGVPDIPILLTEVNIKTQNAIITDLEIKLKSINDNLESFGKDFVAKQKEVGKKLEEIEDKAEEIGQKYDTYFTNQVEWIAKNADFRESETLFINAGTTLTNAKNNYDGLSKLANNLEKYCVDDFGTLSFIWNCPEAIWNILKKSVGGTYESAKDAIDASVIVAEGIWAGATESYNIAASTYNAAKRDLDFAQDARDLSLGIYDAGKAEVVALDASLTKLEKELEDIGEDIANWEITKAAFEEDIKTAEGIIDDLTFQKNATWQNKKDHRSAFSNQAIAALYLEKVDSHTSVTFIHVAKSGAKIDKVISTQIPAINELIQGREIDAVIMSISGNDAGFAKIIKACLLQDPCYGENQNRATQTQIEIFCASVDIFTTDDPCATELNEINDSEMLTKSAQAIIDEELPKLPDLFVELVDDGFIKLDGLYPIDISAENKNKSTLRLDRIYQTEYVDATRDDNLNFCEMSFGDGLTFLSTKEYEWLDRNVEIPLNRAIALAANTHGWNVVDGIYEGFKGHGLCADEHWLSGIFESLLTQHDIKGFVHPNNAGHKFMGKQIFEKVMGDFYLHSDLTQPRLPDIKE